MIDNLIHFKEHSQLVVSQGGGVHMKKSEILPKHFGILTLKDFTFLTFNHLREKISL